MGEWVPPGLAEQSRYYGQGPRLACNSGKSMRPTPPSSPAGPLGVRLDPPLGGEAVPNGIGIKDFPTGIVKLPGRYAIGISLGRVRITLAGGENTAESR